MTATPTERPTATGDADLLYTDVEESLRATVRDLLADRCAPAAVTAMFDGDRSLVTPLWRSLAGDLGLAGLLVPEHLGGAGATAREAAVALEELGRAVAPVPFLTSAVTATVALLACGPEGAPAAPSSSGATADTAAVRDDLLASLAEGRRTAAPAVPFGASVSTFEAAVRAREEGGLDGTVTSVAGALEADLLLVPVATTGGVALHAVDVPVASSAGTLRVDPVLSLDMTRQVADVAFSGAPSTRVTGPDTGAAAVRAGLLVGAALLASEQVGVAQWCLDSTVAYLRGRRQFGRVVGGFQALKHRLADLYAAVEQARAAARYAAATVADADPDRLVAASLAQAYCSDVAMRAAEECIQLHGGIGMTWEHPAHLYLKRAKADQIGLGTPGQHRRTLAELVDVPVS
jgi:alkylation response protein AidB-like acyl-CoA dehydrogenase